MVTQVHYQRERERSICSQRQIYMDNQNENSTNHHIETIPILLAKMQFFAQNKPTNCYSCMEHGNKSNGH